MKWLRNFFRHIRDGFRNFFRNGWMTTLSVFTMTITLVLIGMLVFIIANINELTHQVEDTIYVQANIKKEVDQAGEAALLEKLEALDHVKQVVYSDKQEQLEETAELYGEAFKQVYDDPAKNPLLNAYRIYVDDPTYFGAINDQVKAMPEVAETVEGSLKVDSILKVLRTIRMVVSFIAAVFVVIAILLISNTIKLTIMSRSTEIEIMRLVGATNGYIRAPFTFEGALMGVLSSLMGTGILYLTYEWFQRWAPSVIGFSNFNMVATLPMLAYIGLGLLIIGILLGSIGARRSMRQFLKV